MNNTLRIIGGAWRSRRLQFPPTPELRPTPDRVRETLFNWLRDDVEGACCLDLFAGSGALGLEAASRGAHRVVLVERDGGAYGALLRNRDLLAAGQVEVLKADAETFLKRTPEVFDLVFLDPPFRRGFLGPICEALENGGWLKPGARIYLETERRPDLSALPLPWRVIRSGSAGEVEYFLCERSMGTFSA